MKKICRLLFVTISIMMVVSCATKEKTGWVVNGTINGVSEGTIVLGRTLTNSEFKEFPIIDGKFTVNSDIAIDEPVLLPLSLKGKNVKIKLYAENGVTVDYSATVTETKRDNKRGGTYSTYKLIDEKIIGGEVNEDMQTINSSIQAATKEYNQARSNFYKDRSSISRENLDKLQAESEKRSKELYYNFIKSNPKAYYSAVLVSQLAKEGDKYSVPEMLSLLSAEADYDFINELRAKSADAKEVRISDVIKATNVSYKVDNSYNGTAFTAAKYLGLLSNGNLVSLNNDKTVTIIDANAKEVNTFAVSKSSVPSTMAVDSDDNIYVLIPEEVVVEQVHRGKKVKKTEVKGYECAVYSSDGKQIKSFRMDGVKKATGARIANGKFMIADMRDASISIYDIATGSRETAIKGMRPCCGILDFDLNDKNEIMVANLGAFRVQSYGLDGKQILSFGTRGQGISEFHGCCNPVSVAYLSNGAIVTVEKDPTRVKVYSKEGAVAIAGIDEMVKGCSYIPMIVDSKDNLYLASPTKGVVKCVAI